MREPKRQSERSDAARGHSVRRPWLPLACLTLTATVLLVMLLLGARAAAQRVEPPTNSTAAFRSSLLVTLSGAGPQDYSRFSHSSPGAHAGFSSPSSCAGCHPRNGASPTPTFPGHKACINCHLTQFTTTNVGMCNICHTGDVSGSNPPVKGFPRLRSFRVSYDHNQHIRAGANCTTCHKPARRGVALTAPVDLNAHRACFSCHSPGLSASNLSACGTCHSVGGYALSTPGARAYSANFSHATHGSRQRLNCTDCHTVLRSGLPPSRQVTSPATFQHFAKSRAQSCLTCHNGQRAFGDRDFGDCKRCHKGTTFRMGG